MPNEITRYDKKYTAVNTHNDKFLQNNNGHGEGTDTYFTLSFDYKFEHLNDEVWFAHAVPYTYTDMQTNIKQIMIDKEEIMRTEILCNTLSGLPVPLLTITDNVNSYITHGDQLIVQSELQPTLKK